MARSRIVHPLWLVPLVLSLAGCQAVKDVVGGLDEPDPVADRESFSVLHHEPPQGMQWVECPDGRNEGRMRSIGSTGGELSLSAGHRLEVTRGAVAAQTDFLLLEPRSQHIAVHAQALGVQQFGADGVVLRMSWEDRTNCTVPDNAVIARVVPRGKAEPLPVIERGPDYIRVRLHSMSTFVIAH